MSTESGFSFSLSPHGGRRLQPMLPVLATGVMLVCLPDAAFTYSGVTTTWLAYSALVVTSLVICWRIPFTMPPLYWLVSDSGRIRFGCDRSKRETGSWYRLTSNSRVVSGALYLHFTVVDSESSQRSQSFWLFRGELPERYFRRLSRLIINSSHSRRNVLFL